MRQDELPMPAVVYEAGDRRTHAEHAAEAYDLASRSESLRQMDGHLRHGAAHELINLAQWHATMAVYELLALQGSVIA